MESTARKRNIASLQMLTCAALWSIAGIFIKLIDANGMVIAGFRSLIASLVFVFYIRKNKIKIVFNKNVLTSTVFLAATFFAFVWANRLTTAANAIVLQFTAPVFIIIISALFLRQKYAFCDILTVILTLIGISLFFFDQINGGQRLGNLIGLFSGFTMAGMFIAVKQNSASARMSGMLFGHLLTAIIGIPFVFFTENVIDTNFTLCILILGIVQLGIPYLLMALATEHCPPLTLSLLSAVEPLLNPVWVAIFYGEMPGIFAFIGGIVVIVTITAWCIYKELKLRNNRTAS